jgi:hypothetical protein
MGLHKRNLSKDHFIDKRAMEEGVGRIAKSNNLPCTPSPKHSPLFTQKRFPF